MNKLTALIFGFTFLTVPVGHLLGEEPAKRLDDPKTYTVSCKLFRNTMVTGSGGKTALEKTEVLIPDLTTLAGSRAEYHTGGKLDATPYGFRLEFKVTPASGEKIRLELLAEDSLADLARVPIIRSQRQQVVRHLTLGKVLRLQLDKHPNGEGAWVELIVQEAAE